MPHEITLVALTRDEAGLRSIVDIVETSLKNASIFARRWCKDLEISEISAMPPGKELAYCSLYARTIWRGLA